MVQMVKIIGMGKIKANLRLANIKMGVAGRRGLLKAGLFLQRKSQKVVPWEFRILENSAGTKPIGEGWHTDVVVYYTASYAVYVHEITTNKHKPGRKAKFLEDPAREYRAEILKIIAKEAGRL